MEKAAYVVLGGVIAVITNLIVELVKQRLQQARLRRLLSSLLRDEVEAICQILKRVADDTAKLGFVSFASLNEIDSARAGYDRNRDWIILYKDERVRRDIFQFYLDLIRACAEARGAEQMRQLPNFSTDSNLQSYYAQTRSELIGRFRSLADRAKVLVGELEQVNK